MTNNTLRKCGHPGPPGMSLQQPRASQAQMVGYSGSHLSRHQPPTPQCAHGPVKGALRQSCLQQKSKLQAMEAPSMVRQMAAWSDTGCQPGRQVLRCWAQQSQGNLMGRGKSLILSIYLQVCEVQMRDGSVDPFGVPFTCRLSGPKQKMLSYFHSSLPTRTTHHCSQVSLSVNQQTGEGGEGDILQLQCPSPQSDHQ